MAESLEQVPSDDCNRFLEDELEALRSIYISETNVYEDNDATIVSLDLHPATADNLEEQYVKLTLKLTVKDGYPDVIPEIEIRNPRGLSDEKLSRITNDLSKMAEDKRGSSMLFEIIEAAKDYLTEDNRPCEECAICLYGFHDDDIFTKTECYHYFHSHCLARYAKNSSVSDDDSKSEDSSKNELLCPVCRLPIHFDGIDDSYPSPVKAEDEFSVTDTMLQTQKKLQELYIKQVEKGGIIDLEAEKNKYLIEISNVPSVLDAASEAKSEEDINSKMTEERDKTQATSPSENVKNAKLDSQKYSSNRPSNSGRSDHRYTKYNEDRRRNEVSGPHGSNDYRNERYQSNRGNNRYRRDSRGGRNNYERRYDSYNSERSSGGMNRNRFNNPRRGNWHENQQKGNRYDRHDRYDDRNSQRHEKHQYDDKNNQKYESRDKYDGGHEPASDDPKDQRNKQDPEEGATCRDDAEDDRPHDIDQRSEDGDDNVQNEKIDEVSDKKRNNRYGSDRKNMSYREGDRSQDVDQKSDDGDNNIQDEEIDKVSDEKRNHRYSGDRKNMSYRGGYRNNQYDDRRENRYDRQNARYDNNKRYGRYEDNRAGQYERRNGRFDSRKYNEHSGSRRNDNFAPGRSNRPNEVNRNRNFNQDIDNQESGFSKENEVNAKNTSPVEKERKNSHMPHETVGERSLNESEPCTDSNESGKHFSKDEAVPEDAVSESRHESKSDYFSDRKQNLPNRISGTRKQTENRNYNRQYQRSNSNGERYNGTGGYPKQPNYHSDRRQSKPQNFRRHSDNLDEGENSNALNSNESVVEGAGEPNESNVEENQAHNNEESDDFPDNQHSRKSSARTESGNTGRYKNYRDGKQGYNNRYQNNNRNYHETRPYRNNPRSRNNQSDYSDRTSNGGKRYIPQKYASDSSYNSARTDNDSDVKPEVISKENAVEPVPEETPSKKPTQVPPKSSELEKSVPTSNFLPPMSSVAPPPGFQNPTRKIVYGLAAANPPPGFNRS